jgi:hypothetical protein
VLGAERAEEDAAIAQSEEVTAELAEEHKEDDTILGAAQSKEDTAELAEEDEEEDEYTTTLQSEEDAAFGAEREEEVLTTVIGAGHFTKRSRSTRIPAPITAASIRSPRASKSPVRYVQENFSRWYTNDCQRSEFYDVVAIPFQAVCLRISSVSSFARLARDSALLITFNTRSECS